MMKESGRLDEHHTAVNHHLLHVFLMEINRLLTSTPIDNCSLENIRSYINENFYKKLNFTELADMSGYSYDYFRHFFKMVYGVSPQTYLIHLRLETAYSILSSTPDTNITEVAANCGFSDCSQFSSMFTKHFGISPTKIRKRARDQYQKQVTKAPKE